ncbi:Histone methylation protein DOT1 [Sulfurivirga caldicuralii]|uniref:Histone methylation protein DOT1 n=2 Tax=Sulfurivirga caldicuralii TaxID=364032 RepID=A0A1N6GY45_9GAMM|nr:Histone methylation protein DOT1 [Sulfurivirga caldicuralii]
MSVRFLPVWVPPPYPLWPFVAAQSLLTAAIAWMLRWPRWWVVIQLLFPPLLVGALAWQVPGWIVVVLVILLVLVFWNAGGERVPLYISNASTQRALGQLTRSLAPVRFVDLGCGWGDVVAAMARQTHVEESVGVETAPLSYLIARWRARAAGGIVLGKSLWDMDLSRFNVVYAFLSPQPMAQLQDKALAEMAPNSLFVSNSFPFPDVEPSEIWQVNDRRQTLLYVYRFDENRQLVPPEDVSDEPAY